MVTNYQATTLLGAAVLVLLLLSFFISGAEMAFFSLTFRDINMLTINQNSENKKAPIRGFLYSAFILMILSTTYFE